MEERENRYIPAKGNKEILDGFRLFVVFDYSLWTIEINKVEENIIYTVENPRFPKSVAPENLTDKNSCSDQNQENTYKLDVLIIPIAFKTVVLSDNIVHCKATDN